MLTGAPSISARESYDAWHQQQGLARECNDVWHQLIKAHLSDFGGLASKRIMEIGCGRGAFTHWLASQQPGPTEVIGADFSPAAIDLARQLPSPAGPVQLDWQVQDIQNIQYDHGRFDIVVSCETIEHVPEPRRAIAELVRILKPGGHLVLTHPNYFSTIGLYRVYRTLRGDTWRESGQPINHPLRIGQVRRWLKEAGLELTLFVGRGHYLLLPRRHPKELLWLQNPQWFMRWFGFHPLLIGRKRAE